VRKIITTTFVTLDGVMQAPGGPEEDPSNGFEFGGWQASYLDAAGESVIAGYMELPFEMLLGKTTYDIFAAYWPSQDGHIADPFNSTKKYVVSGTHAELSWDNSLLVTGDVVEEIKKLKAIDAPDLWVWGSGNLIQTLLKNELVDQMNIWTNPVTLGEGKRLFENGIPASGWKLVESQLSTSGVVISTYEPAGPVTTGTIGG
jgi:dihydrofolate reductase